MKLISSTAGVLILLAFFVILSSGPAGAGELNWNDYTKGMEIGEQLEKKIFINFYAGWCKYCHKLEKETFGDQTVADYLSENFVLIRVNADQNKDLATSYSVRGLPMSWFVDHSGKKIGPLPGFVPPETFLAILKYVTTESYKKMKFQEFMDKGLNKQ
ncbi:MAG: thioredoxin fold domain-containing protein [Thermodesulfobacteriota bacterium]|nr:thioredoxin fold domain-containing protein [Thermodesulfobacteriota bacterium]